MTLSKSPRHLYFVLVPASVLWLLPSLMLLNGALRPDQREMLSIAPTGLTLSNLTSVWRATPLARMLANSAFVTLSSVAIVVIAGSLAGFALANFRWRGAGLVTILLISSIILAPAAIIVPLYDLIVRLHLLNNYIALIGPYSAFGLAAAVLLYRNAFNRIPREFSEAATVDGATTFQIYFKIYMPLALTTTVTVMILQFLGAWNDYLLALLFMTDSDKQTSQLAFIAFQGQYFSSLPKQFAVMTLIALPVVGVFLAGQRAFVAGLTAGGVEQ